MSALLLINSVSRLQTDDLQSLAVRPPVGLLRADGLPSAEDDSLGAT